MTKPNDIPQDIWDAADGTTNRISGELVKALTEGSEATADGLIQAHVAHAILAERERCAKIKPEPDITRPENGYGDGYVEGFWDCRARFVSAIRTPSP